MRTRSAVNRGGRGVRGGRSVNIELNNIEPNLVAIQRVEAGNAMRRNRRGANRGRGNRVGNRIVEKDNVEQNLNSINENEDSNSELEQVDNPDIEINNSLPRRHAPTQSSAMSTPMLRDENPSSVSTYSFGNIAPVLKEPENPIPFKAALEFLPKSFDGSNISVSRFISDCLFARDSIAAKDRHFLFLMIRSRIIGNPFDSLQDRDLNSLEQLLKHLKITFTDHRNLSQLNSALAIVA